MLKPDSLRAFLTAAVPALRAESDRLKIFMEKGQLRCALGQHLGWEYAYTLTLQIIDFTGHPDTVAAPLLCWVRVNQPDLLQNRDRNRDGITFEAEILDNDKVDMEIQLPLTERVTCARAGDGTFTAIHQAEPVYDQVFSAGFDPQPWVALPAAPFKIYLDDELVEDLTPEGP